MVPLVAKYGDLRDLSLKISNERDLAGQQVSKGRKNGWSGDATAIAQNEKATDEVAFWARAVFIYFRFSFQCSELCGYKWHILAVVPGMEVTRGPDRVVDVNLPVKSKDELFRTARFFSLFKDSCGVEYAVNDLAAHAAIVCEPLMDAVIVAPASLLPPPNPA